MTFKLATTQGVPVIGFGSTARPRQPPVGELSQPCVLARQARSGPGGTPSKWVNYIVTTVADDDHGAAAPTRPSTDNTGTLVDNEDGTYTYTFYRDVPTIKAQVDAMTAAAPQQQGRPGRPDVRPDR